MLSVVLAVAASIPTYPGATSFCSQHVMGAPGGPSISWTAYHTADAPETVVAWYERQLAAGLHRREGREDVWRVPFEAPEAVMSVAAATEPPPPIAECRTKPPASARTIILMSTISRPAAAPKPAAPRPVRRSFPAAGVTSVVLRAAEAESALVSVARNTTSIEVSGVPTGGAPGYHSPDPNSRETPPEKWGLDFVSVQRGPVLVVSTRNEVHYLHHHYRFASVTLQVPPGVEVVRERRELTEDGKPDLR
jgi:hypothetical protein